MSADDASADTEPASSDSGSTSAAKKRAVNVGDTLGRYELVEEIGEGGMATVYRARDTQLRREVAVKVLFAHFAKRQEIVRRFHREARAAAVLEHGNILRIYDVGGGEGDDPPYIVMELIRGPTLLGEIEQRGPMLSELAACVGALLADALAAAHEKGVIHRDVKPGNVLIAPGGRVLLADFGVAHLETEDSLVTRTGALLGTPAYMSPEQATGEPTTAQSDVYSLGATLYQLVTGALPYSGPPAKVIAQITHGTAPTAVRRRAEVGPDLSRAIERMMDVDPLRRPARAVDVAAELRAIASAGGLGDAREELAAYFGAPEEIVKARAPVVVTKVIETARAAIADRKLPRAMALADRAAALAPEDDAVKSLVAEVTRGGRASRRRRMLALAALSALGAAAAVVGVIAVASGGGADEEEPTSVAVAAAKDAAAPPVVQAVTADAATVARAEPVDAMPMPAPAQPRATDAGVARVRAKDAAVETTQPLAVIEAPADAAVIEAPPDAAPQYGTIRVGSPLWCQVSIDGKKMKDGDGRNIGWKVTAGRHTVTCEQPNTDLIWRKDVDVIADKVVAVTGDMRTEQLVVVKTKGPVMIDNQHLKPGQSIRLKMPARVDVVEEGVAKNALDLHSSCALREEGDRLVCEPLSSP